MRFAVVLALLLVAAVAVHAAGEPKPSANPSTLTIDACNKDEIGEVSWNIDAKSRATMSSTLQSLGPLIIIDKCPSGAGGDLIIQFTREIVVGASSVDRDGALRVSTNADGEEDLEGRIPGAGWVSLTSFQPDFSTITSGEPYSVFRVNAGLGAMYTDCAGQSSVGPGDVCSGHLPILYNTVTKETVMSFRSHNIAEADICTGRHVSRAVFCALETDAKCAMPRTLLLSIGLTTIESAEISIGLTGLPTFVGVEPNTPGAFERSITAFQCTTSACPAIARTSVASSRFTNPLVVSHAATDFSVIYWSTAGAAANTAALRKAYVPTTGAVPVVTDIPLIAGALPASDTTCCDINRGAVSVAQKTAGSTFWVSAVVRTPLPAPNQALERYQIQISQCTPTPLTASKYTCAAPQVMPKMVADNELLGDGTTRLAAAAALGATNIPTSPFAIRSTILNVANNDRLFTVVVNRVTNTFNAAGDFLAQDHNPTRSTYEWLGFLCTDAACSTYQVTQIIDSDLLLSGEWDEDLPEGRDPAETRAVQDSEAPLPGVLSLTTNPTTGFATLLVSGKSGLPLLVNCHDAACLTADITIAHDALIGSNGDAGVVVSPTDATVASAALWGENANPVLQRFNNTLATPRPPVKCDRNTVGLTVNAALPYMCTKLPKRPFEVRLGTPANGIPVFNPLLTQTTLYSWVELGGRLRNNVGPASPICFGGNCPA